MGYIIAKRKRGDFIIAQTNYLYRCITERTYKMHPENAVDGVYVKQFFPLRKMAREFLKLQLSNNNELDMAPITKELIEFVKKEL